MFSYIYNNIESLFLIFMFYAIFGFLMEVTLKLISEHKFINRGFLIGPYCPIYGWGAVVITILLRDYSSNVFVLFVMSMFICTIIEYFTSYFMEKTFKVRWWDYSQKKFNLNGRVCLPYAIFFGIGGVLIVDVINPFVQNVISLIPVNLVHIISISLFVIIIVDNIVSGIVIRSFKNLAKIKSKDATEDISVKVKEVMDDYKDKALDDIRIKSAIISSKIQDYRSAKTLEIKKELSKRSFLHRRLLNAFPNASLKNKKDNDIKKNLN